MTETIPFDPGLGKLVQDSNSYINDFYSQMMNLHSISQKRVRFRLFYNKIYQSLENNIAFYCGCLLWAYYIKSQNTVTEIEGNPFLNLTKEQAEDYDYLMQVNFFDNYFDSYERDTQYYIGKKIIIPDKWRKILELYKEFLELNKGFINTKTSDDLLLPEEFNIKNLEKDKVKVNILNAIEKKDIKILLEFFIV